MLGYARVCLLNWMANLHAGGWTVGNLDEFEGGMRIFAEESGHQVRLNSALLS